MKTNKHIERATWDNTIEGYPCTPWRAILFIVWFAFVTAFVVVQYVVGADDFIYYVANLIK